MESKSSIGLVFVSDVLGVFGSGCGATAFLGLTISEDSYPSSSSTLLTSPSSSAFNFWSGRSTEISITEFAKSNV